MSIDQQFNIVSDKLQLLIKQYNRLHKENERLKEELLHTRNNEISLKDKMMSMQESVSVSKLTSGKMNDQDKKDFEKKVNAYIKEIEKCIVFLSQ